MWRTAELWRRLAAKCVDLALFLLIFSPAVDAGVRQTFRLKNIGPFALVTLIFPLLEIVLVKLFQGTPGKRMFKLRVIRLDAKRPNWTDAIQRQWLLLVLMISQSLQVGTVLPGLQAEFDLQALAQAVQDSPGIWTVISDLSTALLFASSLLVLFRPDRRSLQDLLAGTVVVRPAPAPSPRG